MSGRISYDLELARRKTEIYFVKTITIFILSSILIAVLIKDFALHSAFPPQSPFVPSFTFQQREKSVLLQRSTAKNKISGVTVFIVLLSGRFFTVKLLTHILIRFRTMSRFWTSFNCTRPPLTFLRLASSQGADARVFTEPAHIVRDLGVDARVAH